MATIQTKSSVTAAILFGAAGAWLMSIWFPWTETMAIFLGATASLASLAVGVVITNIIGGHLGLRNVRPKKVRAVISAKYYTPSISSSGVGIAVNPQGGVGPVMASSSSDEEYTVEIKLAETRDKVRISVDKEVFDSIEEDDRVEASYQVSSFSGDAYWNSDIVKVR